MFSITRALVPLFRQIPGFGRMLASAPYRVGRSQTGATGRVYSMTSFQGNVGTFLRRAAQIAGVGAVLDFFIPDDLIPDFLDFTDFELFGGGVQHPSRVVKSWATPTANFIHMENGLMGAEKKDGTWTYWRPRKPIVLFSSGNDTADLKRAFNALKKDAKTMKQIVNMVSPPRRKPSKKELDEHMHAAIGRAAKDGKSVVIAQNS